jgi:hypothetical protein
MSEPDDNVIMSDAGRRADDRLIHALLLHMHDEQAAEHRERRVQRAMGAIREDEQASPSPAARVPVTRTLRFPAWAGRVAWAAAAMVLIAVGMWVFTYSPTPAMASLNDILSALGRPGDRTYRIQMEDLPEPPGRRPTEENWPPDMPRPNLDDARLYLRDGRQYLLVRHDPKGGLIYDGYDGRQSWRVRDGVVAQTKAGPGAGGIPMPPMMADVPFCDLHQTLERIRVDYTVERLDTAALPSGGRALRHVLVRRNSREVKGPETIEIWADPKTAVPHRIIFDRAKIQGNREPCRLTFELTSDEPLSQDWFTPSPHIRSQ